MPQARISYDRFHVVALANEAMDEVRSAEWKQEGARVKEELGPLEARERRSVLWAMRRNPSGWSAAQGKLTHLPTSPFVPAMPRDDRRLVRRV